MESGPKASTAFNTMLRSAGIFLAAILLPSLVLAWLAVRSAHDQEILLQHQQAIICQDVTDSLAKSVRGQVDTIRSEFVQITQDLISKSVSPMAAASTFDHVLRAQWPPAEVGFAVDLRGAIFSPGRSDGPAARMFYEENERFLTNREFVEVYPSFNSQSLVTHAVPLPVQTDSVAQTEPSDLTANLKFAQNQPLPSAPLGGEAAAARSQFSLAEHMAADRLQNENAKAVAKVNSTPNSAQVDSVNSDSLDEAIQQKGVHLSATGSRREDVADDQIQAAAVSSAAVTPAAATDQSQLDESQLEK